MRHQRTIAPGILILILIPILILCLAVPSAAGSAAEGGGFGDHLAGIWRSLFGPDMPDGIARANGRIEAERVLIAAKRPGRLVDVAVREGDMLDEGAVVARLDAAELSAQRDAAAAAVLSGEEAVEEARAAIAQAESERALAQLELDRATTLKERGSGTVQAWDIRRSEFAVAGARERAAVAGLHAAEARVVAARARVAEIEAAIADTVLVAPVRGRVEYKLAQTGEVVGSGAPIATLLDLTDVTMTIFLPARVAGRLAIGDEARIVLDPVPQYVIPATVSFVAGEAQFTPRTVETETEREKLMFRVKLRIAPSLLKTYEAQVKTGVRGVGYVRESAAIDWPAALAIRLPE